MEAKTIDLSTYKQGFTSTGPPNSFGSLQCPCGWAN